MSTLYPTRTKPKRKWTPPKDSKLLKLAQKENFALFLLKGRSLHFLRGVVRNSTLQQIDYWQKMAIAEIKAEQETRKLKKENHGKTK